MARIATPAAAHVGSLIRELRLKRGLSQDDLASKTKIDSSNIRSYESGRALVGLHSQVKTATVLRVQPGSLLKGLELSMFEKDA